MKVQLCTFNDAPLQICSSNKTYNLSKQGSSGVLRMVNGPGFLTRGSAWKLKGNPSVVGICRVLQVPQEGQIRVQFSTVMMFH